MWRFSKNMASNIIKNICGSIFHRSVRDTNCFIDVNQPLCSWLISGCPFGPKHERIAGAN
jgi:hypothetical protein